MDTVSPVRQDHGTTIALKPHHQGPVREKRGAHAALPFPQDLLAPNGDTLFSGESSGKVFTLL